MAFDAAVDHPLQSWAWGDFRASMGHDVLRLGVYHGDTLQQGYTLTAHKMPLPVPGFWGQVILYCPRSHLPNHAVLEGIKQEAKKARGMLVRFEPDVAVPIDPETDETNPMLDNPELEVATFLNRLDVKDGRALFTEYDFWLDLTPSDDELMKNMKSKTRYNLRLARRKGVEVQEDNSDEAFETYLALMEETTLRQGFFAHSVEYHRKMWQTLRDAGIAHLFTASYQDEIITTWILFKWKDRLYYPYGASSRRHRNVMANNLMMWTAIQFGKEHGCTSFDLWGTAGRIPDPEDSWAGFHRFKQGFGPQMVQYIGTYDFVVDGLRYPLLMKMEEWRHQWLDRLAERRRRQTAIEKTNN